MQPKAQRNKFGFPDLGIGVGLRTVHYGHVLEEQPPVDWFEIITENFIGTHGRPVWVLEQVAERYPVVMHGVSLSIGSTDPLDFEYLRQLKELALCIRAPWVSDHLCWTGVAGRNLHDLLPVPYTEECLRHVIRRVKTVQEFLERPIALENPSSYVEFTSSSMPEWEFLARLAEEADCALLLDVNNVYVSSFNHGFDPFEYIDAIPHERVVQYHLAGHTNHGTHIIDSHNGRVIDEVWRVFERSLAHSGGRSTLLEWDEDIPAFEEVHAEALRAREWLERARTPRKKKVHAGRA